MLWLWYGIVMVCYGICKILSFVLSVSQWLTLEIFYSTYTINDIVDIKYFLTTYFFNRFKFY
jgi:hypothetical protein